MMILKASHHRDEMDYICQEEIEEEDFLALRIA